MKLYNYFRSSASYRVRLALAFKGLDYEYVPVHLLKNGGEQHAQTYKDVNPMRQVPSLVDGDFSISQSLVILEYLDEKYPNKKLFPYRLKDRLQVKEFCEHINSGIQPLVNLKVMQTLEQQFNADETQKKDWMFRFLDHGFEAIETRLAKTSGSFCFGNDFSAADCFLVPQVFSAKRIAYPVERYANIYRINNNILAQPFSRFADPSAQPDSN